MVNIYLKVYISMAEVNNGLTNCFQFYNEKGWHNKLDRDALTMLSFITKSQEKGCGKNLNPRQFSTS